MNRKPVFHIVPWQGDIYWNNNISSKNTFKGTEKQGNVTITVTNLSQRFIRASFKSINIP